MHSFLEREQKKVPLILDMERGQTNLNQSTFSAKEK